MTDYRPTCLEFQALCGELLLPVTIIHEDQGLRMLVQSGATLDQLRQYLTASY
jgi:uncharacterized SAM-dependent methyltransferase